MYEVVRDTEPYDFGIEPVVGEEFGYGTACAAVDDTVFDGNDVIETPGDIGE